MSLETEIQSLNNEQRAAVFHSGNPLLILAGAGAGKTKVITTKIAYLVQSGVPAFKILAVTFTNKAAREMKERAINLCAESSQSSIKTFHSFGAWFLRKFYSDEVGNLAKNFSIYDDDDCAALLRSLFPSQNKQTIRRLQHKISRAKDDFLLPEDIDESSPYANIKEAYERYQNKLRSIGNVDFGDLIMLPALCMQKNPEIKKHIHHYFTVILVDEFQDTNVAQMALLKELYNEKNYLCVVGDDDQSIYKFRGASISNILTFQKIFPGTEIIKLEQNYRSTPQILKVANSIIKNNDGRLGKTLQATRAAGIKPIVFIEANQTMEAERAVNLIADDVYKNKKQFSDWAILYRTNAQSRVFETKFLQEHISYKVVGSLQFYEREEVKDTIALLRFILNTRDEISFKRIINKPPRGIGAISQEKILGAVFGTAVQRENDTDDETDKNNLTLPFSVADDRKTMENHDNTEINEAALLENMLHKLEAVKLTKKIKTEAIQFFKNIFSLRSSLSKKELPTNKTILLFSSGLSAFIANALEVSGLAAYHQTQDEIQNSQKLNNLQELVSMSVNFQYSFDGLLEFLETLSLDASLSTEAENDNAVTLITVHGTKGLEFENVIISGLEENIFPLSHAESIDDIEEERRLMYVACTRAKNKLFMTLVQNRMWAGRASEMYPSRFIAEIDENLISIKNYLRPISENHSIKKNQNFVFPKMINDTAQKNSQKSDSVPETKWKKGTIVFHEEFGYGKISSCEFVNGTLCFEVRFENKRRQVYFPDYNFVPLEIVNPDEWN